MKNKIHKISFLLGAVTLMMTACEKGYFPQPPKPKTALETQTLEASYVTTPPVNITDAFWKNADFLKVPVADLNTGALYGNGFLNMTGTYQGLKSFNGNASPNMIMKAAYDNTKLYVYLEWTDSDYSPMFEAGYYYGPSDPLKPGDTTGKWTSQGNSDKVALAFDISNASSSAGTFTDKGCAASCHNSKMQPASGSVDIWNWDLALSEPLGYARDMKTDASGGLVNDAGTPMYASNKTVPGDPRSAPAFEWDGTEQSVTPPVGKATRIDPGFYLLNKTPFIGDMEKGREVYDHPSYGCGHCHGEHGEGEGNFGEGTAFAATGFASKHSRASIKDFSGNQLHTGKIYWAQVPPSSYDDLIAYIKGMGGIPGNYLTTPTGSSANIWSVSNVTKSKINTVTPHTVYKVILVRDLSTGNPDDIQFTNPEGKTFPFGVALMDQDGKNHIGSLKQILTFKTK